MNRRRFLAVSAAALSAGSPGMEGPRSEPYEVLLFQRDGRYATYAKYAR